MGGVAGHLSHLYDNREMTFNEMKKMMTKMSKKGFNSSSLNNLKNN